MTKKRKSQNNRWCIIPNELILKSCKAKEGSKEEFCFPVYWYSIVNANYADNGIVDTNISLIQSTIANFGRTFQQISKIKETLKDFGTGENKCIDYRYRLDNVESHTRLQFYVRPYKKEDCEGGFTIFEYDEYHYIMDTVYSQQINKDENERSYNTIILINLFGYMKMRINQYDSMGGSHHMNESQKTIAEVFGKSNKTIATYLKRLEKIGMIKKIEGELERPVGGFRKKSGNGKNVKANKTNDWYVLSDDWRNNFDGTTGN